MATANCENCMFSGIQSEDIFICRRLPPQLEGRAFNADRFPRTKKDEWCGEYKKEKK